MDLGHHTQHLSPMGTKYETPETGLTSPTGQPLYVRIPMLDHMPENKTQQKGRKRKANRLSHG